MCIPFKKRKTPSRIQYEISDMQPEFSLASKLPTPTTTNTAQAFPCDTLPCHLPITKTCNNEDKPAIIKIRRAIVENN